MEDIEKDMKPRFIEDLGMLYPTENSTRKYRYGLYECQYCGKHWRARPLNDLNSCGCQRINKTGITHGLTQHRFYKTWKGMVGRCNNPKNSSYKNYGGRGITVCEEWLDVRNFIAWCEMTHPNIEDISLDRIDNDKGYSPENCRWANKLTQNINQRKREDNTSGYVGIYWNKDSKKWDAKIGVNNKLVYIGKFPLIENAIEARNSYIIENELPHKLTSLVKSK